MAKIIVIKQKTITGHHFTYNAYFSLWQRSLHAYYNVVLYLCKMFDVCKITCLGVHEILPQKHLYRFFDDAAHKCWTNARFDKIDNLSKCF